MLPKLHLRVKRHYGLKMLFKAISHEQLKTKSFIQLRVVKDRAQKTQYFSSNSTHL